MIKVIAVKYLNTLPFIRAIQSSGNLRELIELKTADPKECAEALLQDKVDLALLPIGAFVDFEELFCQVPYCIASKDEVGTVGVFSDLEWDTIRTIELSASSRSSNMLLNTMNIRFWNNRYSLEPNGKNSKPDGRLIIGDEAFHSKKKYKYYYDLGKMWSKHTLKPFVFAIWASKKELKQGIIDQINQAFAKFTDLNELNVLIQELQETHTGIQDYFQKQIRYELSSDMKESLLYFKGENNIQTILHF